MPTAVKTNERPGTKAVLKHYMMSASKARQVLDLIRGKDVDLAEEILRTTDREAAEVVAKLLASAVANAVHNDGQDEDDLYISACFADEGMTHRRFRPRARGRASRIRKRTCHITIIVTRMTDDRLARRRAARAATGVHRAARVSASRRRADLSGRLARRRHAAEERAADEAAAAEGEETEEVVDLEGTEVEGEETAEAEGAAEGADEEVEGDAPEAEAADGAEDVADAGTPEDAEEEGAAGADDDEEKGE